MLCYLVAMYFPETFICKPSAVFSLFYSDSSAAFSKDSTLKRSDVVFDETKWGTDDPCFGICSLEVGHISALRCTGTGIQAAEGLIYGDWTH